MELLIPCDFRGKPKGENRWECRSMHLRTLPPEGVTAETCASCPIPHMGTGAPHSAAPPPPADGPGAEQKALLAELDLTVSESCLCEARARQMNAWGVAGCREHRAEIVAGLKEEADKAGWRAKTRAFLNCATAPWLNYADPFGSLVDEAIRRAEAKSAAASPAHEQARNPGEHDDDERQ